MKSASLGAASLLAAAVFAGPAFADGMPGRGRVAGAWTRTGPCTTTANVGLTTDYVFRGISQTNEEAAVQGGVDFTCGKFYAGVWGSSIDFGERHAEIDIYAGFKTSTGQVNMGRRASSTTPIRAVSRPATWTTVEFKVGASVDDLEGRHGRRDRCSTRRSTRSTPGRSSTWEVSFSQALPKVGMFSPTFSATLRLLGLPGSSASSATPTGTSACRSRFLEKWSLDLRYWDTDGEGLAFAKAAGRRALRRHSEVHLLISD